MELESILLNNYLPYSKGVILARAIPAIDGLKPVQRRIIYTMYNMGLLKKDKSKSSTVVGDVMKLHPHGDSSIYEALVRMTDKNEALNVPYIKGKGSFGKVYSRDDVPAAMRYTGAGLTEISKELLNGINENAVDMVDSFDNTNIEPVLLPVSFPSIICNPSNGIAVGTSSNIPAFNITKVCQSTIDILDGKINSPLELVDSIGAPEFSTGGYIHADRNMIYNLCKKGRQSFTVSGQANVYSDRIEITQIPYRTNTETIIAEIKSLVSSKKLKGIGGVTDATDKNGYNLVIDIKRGYNSQDILNKLYRYTKLRMPINFIIRVIVGNRCEELGVYELLQKWIDFRVVTLDRIYTYRKAKFSKQEHLLGTWEIIKDRIKEVIGIVADNKEKEAVEILKRQLSLSDLQAEYLTDMKIRVFTTDNAVKKLKELKEVRDKIEECDKVLGSLAEKHKLIKADLTRIIEKYGKDTATEMLEPVIDNDIEEKVVVDDNEVTVVITEKGFMKRLVTLGDFSRLVLAEDDKEKYKFRVRNNQYILVFTYGGECYKLLVNDIDSSRARIKDMLHEKLGIEKEDIMYIDVSGDYTSHINIIYNKYKIFRVRYSQVSGKRTKYRGLYPEMSREGTFITKEDKFFVITKRRKASYVNLDINHVLMEGRKSFRAGRLVNEDEIFGIQPVHRVPDMGKIDIKKYTKGYAVSINSDILW